ncbi:phosphoglycolate phosphatase [Nocardioides sp. BE266]|uniref:HAD family hydrolase n=1 Tax=Nocardioides sp. BE266 TaxID=2817725 RepID=UPI00285ACBC3|nr:HAD family hydrolase [Nocardioides sp. BE266]MDR7254807.1 phosphoglycolate phosphatase [Nocardioides sp. BE266]
MTEVLSGIDTVVVDLDGTLVDSNYVHVLAWREAFRDVGLDVPSHRIHRVIGVGGDQLVERVAGEAVERNVGDEVRRRHQAHLTERIGLVSATDGASELLELLRSRGVNVVLASSADAETSDRFLDLVDGAASMLSASVTGDDVSRSKPHPDLIEVALAEVEAGKAVVVGDTVWDVEAAAAARVPCIALLTGGIPERTLREAGAVMVFETPRDLAETLRDA